MRHNPSSSIAARLGAAALLLVCTQSLFAADLTVTVENIQDIGGQILVGLFDSAASFPRQIKLGRTVPASSRDDKGAIRVVLTGVQEGVYAVSAVHDKDSNGKLSMNVLGTPTEPYGFSGQPTTMFAPPAFADYSFHLPAPGAAVTAALR